MTLGMETVYGSLQKHLDFSMSYTTFIEPLTFWGFAHLKSKKHGGSAHFSAHINPELSIQRFPMTPAEACRRRFPRALQRCSPQWSIVDPVLSVLEHIFEYMRHFWEHMANIINIYIRNHMANIIWFHVEYIYIYISEPWVFSACFPHQESASKFIGLHWGAQHRIQWPLESETVNRDWLRSWDDHGFSGQRSRRKLLLLVGPKRDRTHQFY